MDILIDTNSATNHTIMPDYFFWDTIWIRQLLLRLTTDVIATTQEISCLGTKL